jgi:aminopeptidase N
MQKIISCLALLFILFNCVTPKSEIPEKGVSLKLNEYRKKTISDLSYQLVLDIPSSKLDSITGNVKISFELASNQSPLTLDFTTDSAHVKSVKVEGATIPYRYVNEHIVIHPEFLKAGANKIEIDFVAGDLSLNRNEDYLYTLFVPDRASTCFPLFDQPNLKATYEITLITPPDWEAVSNGALKEKREVNGKSVYVFDKTQPISSYLAAFAAGKFFKRSQEVNGRTMTMYYRETDTVKVNRNLDEIFTLHDKSLAWLNEYTSIPYPFGKFDFVLIPAFQYGGMEHPGSIFYSESALFLDEQVSITRKMGRASLIAHETAHMWFGDLVTMDWFNDVWMKEVFANFMAAKIVQPSFPEINHNLRFLLSHYPSAYAVDRSAGANPIWQLLENLKNAGTLYGAIIYQKAPVVMRHLERKIGEDMMRASLQEYLKTFSFSNATWDDLVKIIDANSPEDITAWSNVWVKTPGMPHYVWNDMRTVMQQPDTIAQRVWQQSVLVKREKLADTTFYLMSSEPVSSGLQSDIAYLNSDGFGYGYFALDENSRLSFLNNPTANADPVFRGAMWINCWESMVRGDGPLPDRMITYLLNALEKETNPLLVDFLLGNLQTTWWTLSPELTRNIMQTEMENVLWKLIENTPNAGLKNSYLRSYRNIALSDKALDKLDAIWNETLKVKYVSLAEDDKIALAYELALKRPAKQQHYLLTQLSNTSNPDRKSRMQFVIPAISDDKKIRDAFFESLKMEVNREHEPWVLEALNYLHHPLRAEEAIEYLEPSLEWLQEIQLTGDIFFPQRWLQTTFDTHSSKEAMEIVDAFLKEHPDYPYYLKNKILQSTDLPKRAVGLQSGLTSQ